VIAATEKEAAATDQIKTLAEWGTPKRLEAIFVDGKFAMFSR
jgi:hypothetical protein